MTVDVFIEHESYGVHLASLQAKNSEPEWLIYTLHNYNTVVGNDETNKMRGH